MVNHKIIFNSVRNVVLVLFVIFLFTNIVEANTIMFENWESGSLDNWTIVDGPTSGWYLSTSEYPGPIDIYDCIARNTDGETTLSRTISTLGYENINFKFWWSTDTNLLDSGEYLNADWYNGTDWINVFSFSSGGQSIYILESNNLSSLSNNNPNFEIRFRCNSNLATEGCNVDNITISGDFVSDSTPPASVTNLNNQSQDISWIYWIWTNPLDADFLENIIFLNSVNLVNTSNNYYNATSLTENTSYTLVVNTKDTSGNINNTNVSLTALTFATSQPEDNVTLNETVEDAEGNQINVTLEIIDDLDNSTVYSQTGSSHNPNFQKGKKYRIKIRPQNHKIKEIEFEPVNITEDLNQIVDLDDPFDNQGFNYLYAINPVVNFSSDTKFNVTVEASASSRLLYKCNSWNFTQRTCLGEWIFVKSIQPGQEYTIELTIADPGLAEANGTFFDDFEDNDISDWNLITTGAANNWTASTTDPYAGTYHAESIPVEAGENSSMEINVNSSEYVNITFSYYRKLIGLDTVDWFRAKWYDGNDWIIVEETNSATDADYVYKSFTLPSSADNNPDLTIKFECVAGAVSEYCRVDNVFVNGTSYVPPEDTTPPVINSVLEYSDPVIKDTYIKIIANITDDTSVDSALIEINENNYSMIQQSAVANNEKTIFLDNFESGSLNANNWILNGTEYWGVSLIDPLNGSSYHAQVQKTGVGDPSYMEVSINTENHENISFSYYKKLISIDAADDFAVEWYNGTNWIVVEQLGAGIEDDAGYVYQTFNLSNDSNDNSDFKIRFMCECGGVSEYCRIDNVSVTGILTSAVTEIWEYEYLASSLGVYNYTIYANDTNDNNATPASGNFTVIESNITVSETVRDSSDNPVNTTIEIEDENNLTVYNETSVSHNIVLAKGKYKIKVKPKNHKITEIRFGDFNLTHDVNSIVDLEDPLDNQGYNELVSVNPLIQNSTENDTISVTITASNSTKNKILYKCGDWDFENQNCTGNWIAWMAISPGQEYSATFLFGDPGLAEANGTFFDGFESESLDTNNWTKSGASSWQIDNDKKKRFAGLNYITSGNTGGVEDIIETNISTDGYDNIVFRFYYKTEDLVAGDYVAADYYNGTDWIEVLNTQGSTVWTLDENNLGDEANDNLDFKIRLRCKTDSSSEICYVDNVQIDGDEITDTTPPDLLIIYPSDNFNTSDTEIDINYTVGSDAQACWYSNDLMSLNNSIICGENITTIIWSEGQHNVIVWANDSLGNENSSSVLFIIDISSPYFTDETPQDQTLTYGTSLSYDINATDSREFDCFSVNDSRFQINCNGLLENKVPLSSGKYYLNITINDSVNNLNSTIILINITKANPSSGMSLVITPFNNVNYGTQTSTTGSETNIGDFGLIYQLFRDDVLFSNPNTETLNAGIYDYIYNTTGGENYTSGSVNATLTINQSNNAVSFLLNGVSNNLTISIGQQLNASASSDSGVVSLFRNGTGVSFENNQNISLGIGFYEYFVNSSGNQNYILNSTGIFLSVNVTSGPDVTGPLINIDKPEATTYNSNESIELNFSVSDISGVDSCWYNINNGSNQTLVSCQNTAFNVSGEGSYTLYLFSNDSLSNQNSNSVEFNIDLTGLDVFISEPTGAKTSRTGVSLTYIVRGNNLTCWYNIKTSIGGDVIGNTTLVNCSNSSFDVSADGDYILNLYINNSLGSINSTTSSFSVSTGGTTVVSGGGGGGGSKTTIITANGTTKLSLGKIKNLIVEPKVSKKISLSVKNNGTNFLNDCKIKGEGGYASWISSEEIKDLSAGEEYDFSFYLNVPEEVEAGEYILTVSLKCQEISELSSFTAEIIEKMLIIDIINVERELEDEIKIFYSLESSFDTEQVVELQFLLFDSNNEKSVEVKETKILSPNSKQEFEILIPIDSSLEGELNLLVNLNSETYSTFFQENIVLGSPVTGFAIFGELGNREDIIVGILILLFLVFAFFIVRKILFHHKKLKSRKFKSKIKKKGKKKEKKSPNFFKRLFWKLFPKKDKRGIMLIDNNVMDILKEKTFNINCRGKYVRLNLKPKK